MRVLAFLIVAASTALAVPSAEAQGNCARLEIREESSLGFRLRPEVEEFRARLAYRNQPCGFPPLPSGGCASGSQVAFEVRLPPGVRGNVTPQRATFSGAEAVSNLRVSVEMMAPMTRFGVEVSATCQSSTGSVAMDFTVGELFRVVGRALDVRTRGDVTTWRVSLENTGNAKTLVSFEGAAPNASASARWTLPEPVTLAGRFNGREVPNATMVAVSLAPASSGTETTLILKPGNTNGDPATFQEPFYVPLSLIEFRGESPGFETAAVLLAGAVWIARRR